MRLYSNALKAGVLGLSMLAAAPAFLMMAEPAKAGDTQAGVVPPAAPNALPEESKIYSLVEATELSKTPQKQMVFYYDANIDRKYVVSILGQVGAMRKGGYHVIAVPGAKDQPLQVFIDGGTAPQLKFSTEQIWGLQPTKFGMAFYNKFIGKPEDRPVDTAVLEPQL